MYRRRGLKYSNKPPRQIARMLNKLKPETERIGCGAYRQGKIVKYKIPEKQEEKLVKKFLKKNRKKRKRMLALIQKTPEGTKELVLGGVFTVSALTAESLPLLMFSISASITIAGLFGIKKICDKKTEDKLFGSFLLTGATYMNTLFLIAGSWKFEQLMGIILTSGLLAPMIIEESVRPFAFLEKRVESSIKQLEESQRQQKKLLLPHVRNEELRKQLKD